MDDIKERISRQLAVLVGLEVSGVNHAADMLTMQFGPLRPVTTPRGAVRFQGAWALHVQCNWRIVRGRAVLATQDDLSGSDDEARTAIERLDSLLVTHEPDNDVERVRCDESGELSIALSAGLDMVITPRRVADEEDWRFFAPGADAAHFVIEGGRIDPNG
ncbi:hypothetical protein ACVBGC_11460 [Burkholderia stagnalis]